MTSILAQMSGILVLVSGRAGAGKTTFADQFAREFPVAVKSLALATKLKELTISLFRIFDRPAISMADLEDRGKKEQYRTYLQQIGTEGCRGVFGADFWCERLRPEITATLDQHRAVIISDIRYVSEYRWFVDNFRDVAKFMFVVRVRRPGDAPQSTHSSEQEIDSIPWDYIIENDGTMADFASKSQSVIGDIVNKIVAASV